MQKISLLLIVLFILASPVNVSAQYVGSPGTLPAINPDSIISCTTGDSTEITWDRASASYYDLWRVDQNPVKQHGLYAIYSDAENTAAPRFSRVDPNVNFNWGQDPPVPDIDPNTYSVKWTGKVQAKSLGGRYRIRVSHSAGVKVWVDGNKIIEDTPDNNGTYDDSASIDFEANKLYNIKVEFTNVDNENDPTGSVIQLKWDYPNGTYNNDGDPNTTTEIIPTSNLYPSTVNGVFPTLVKSGITPPDKPLLYSGGLYGIYYNEGNTSSHYDEDYKVAYKVDPNINFTNLSLTNPPYPGVDPDDFATTWIGKIKTKTAGQYTFKVITTDDVSLWIGGTQNSNRILDENNSNLQTYTKTVTLLGNTLYDFRMERWFDYGNDGDENPNIQLFWTPPGQTEEIIPSSNFYRLANPDFKSGIYGQYFENTNSTLGNLKIARTDPQINFDDSNFPPLEDILNPSNYTVQWSGYITPEESGDYTFYADFEDYLKVKIGSETLIDQDKSTFNRYTIGTVSLDKNLKLKIEITREHYNGSNGLVLLWSKNGGPLTVVPPSAFYSWMTQPTVAQAAGLTMWGYDDKDLTVNNIARIESRVESDDWVNLLDPLSPAVSPDQTINSDTFGARWSGKIFFPASNINFTTKYNDGVRVYLDGDELVDDWSDRLTTKTSTKTMTKTSNKSYDFSADFYEDTNPFYVNLTWNVPVLGSYPIFTHPETIEDPVSFVDNTALATNGPYYYVLTSVGGTGTSQTPIFFQNSGSQCSKPVISSITSPACSQATINWIDTSGTSSYQIYRSDNWLTPLVTVPGTARSYTDTSALSGTSSYVVAYTLPGNPEVRSDAVSHTSDPACIQEIPQINLYLTNNVTGVTKSYADLPLTAKQNESVSISWDTLNVPAGSTACTASIPSSNPPPELTASWNGSKAESGNQALFPISTIGNYQLRLTCSNIQGQSSSTITLSIIQAQKPYIQTTGGDVHTNESITIPRILP